jgi:hypothetical protein
VVDEMNGRRDNPAQSVTATRTVLAGGYAWLIALVALRPGWPEAMLLLAALVAVPLGLGLVAPPDVYDRRAWAWRAAVRLQVLAALTLAASFARPVGAVAACLALPWLTVTGLAALCGLARFRRGPRDLAETCLDAGQVYLAVGGTWAVLSRAGLRPLGFPDVIVGMTAVHFHYAGFALAVLAGLVARATGGAVAGAACLGVIAGVPLVAAGITEAQVVTGLLPPRMLDLVASGLMAASGILVGGLQVRLAALPDRPASARLLLALSGVAVLGPMSLAVAYALGGFTNTVWITIAEMFRYHGAVNALGFALPGLMAWSLMAPDDRPSGS